MPLHLILTLLACSIPCSSAFAARLLNYTISQGGQPLVRGIYSDDGLQPRDAVWSFAKSVQFRIVPHAKFPLKSPTDLECKLEGPVDIRVQHTSTDLIAVTIKGLTLVRPDSSSRDWTLKEGEVERVAALLPKQLEAGDKSGSWNVWGWSAGLIVLLVIAVVIAMRRVPVNSASENI
jgi:hypothetical protein